MVKEDEEAVEEDKSKLAGMSEISLNLDSYDDIFSDFDPRPYSERAMSQDFLAEAHRASIDKGFGQIELNFLIPKNKRKKHEDRRAHIQ